MFLISGFTVRLDNPSRDYQRISVLLHLSAIFILFYAQLSWIVMVALWVFLLFMLRQTLNAKVPFPAYTKLIYNKQVWSLYTHKDEVKTFEIAQIRIDARLFILMTLMQGKYRKNLIVFTDQMTNSEYRLLKIMDRVR